MRANLGVSRQSLLGGVSNSKLSSNSVTVLLRSHCHAELLRCFLDPCEALGVLDQLAHRTVSSGTSFHLSLLVATLLEGMTPPTFSRNTHLVAVLMGPLGLLSCGQPTFCATDHDNARCAVDDGLRPPEAPW